MRRNLLTVPSCDVHNLKKSGDDTYFLWVMCCNLPANSVALRQVETKLARALRRDATLFSYIDQDAKDVTVVDSHTGRAHEAVQLTADGPRLARIFDLIARGLFRAHFGQSWLGTVDVHPDFIDFPEAPDQESRTAARVTLFNGAERLFAPEHRHGENPDVFCFKVHEPGVKYRCLMRLVFYGSCTATAFFGED